MEGVREIPYRSLYLVWGIYREVGRNEWLTSATVNHTWNGWNNHRDEMFCLNTLAQNEE